MGRMREYLDAIERYRTQNFANEIYREAIDLEPAAKAIMQKVLPGFRDYWLGSGTAVSLLARDQAVQALVLLEQAQEIRRKIGDPGPEVSAARFHRIVWESAKTLWESGHYAQAVESAWRAINARMQTLVGRRDVSDDALVNETLSPSAPGVGRIKLRFPGDDSDLTRLSRQRGLHFLGQACVAGMRNVVAHNVGELPEQIAIEYLASMSILARWIDETVPVTGK